MFRFTWLMLLLPVLLYAQPPDSLWSRRFGGSGYDECLSVQQTRDNGYILAGYTYSYGAGESDFWLIKTDNMGDSVWSRTFGGSSDEFCESVRQTDDDGYILAGYTHSFGSGQYDMLLVKTDANGDSMWSHTYGGFSDEYCYSTQQTEDGGYILTGCTYSFGSGNGDFWLVKTDANGDSLWSHSYGGSGDDICLSIQQTQDGGYILAGYSTSFGAGSTDFWVVKTDANGDSLWSRTYGGNYADGCSSIQKTLDGGYVLAGYTYSFGIGSPDSSNFWMVKTDANGDSLWSRTFGGTGRDLCYAILQTTDSSYVLAGFTFSFGVGNADFWLVKTDNFGDSLWSRTFGGNDGDVCGSVQVTEDGGYILAGSTSSFGASNYDFWLVKTRPDHTSAADPIILHPSAFSLSSYPNPFNPTTTLSFPLPNATKVKLSVFDVTGRLVSTLSDEIMQAGEHHVTFDASLLPSGIYFARLDAGDFVQTQKMVLLK